MFKQRQTSRNHFNPDALTPRKIDEVIEMLKESCLDCKNNTQHECCISVIIDDWKEMKNEFRK